MMEKQRSEKMLFYSYDSHDHTLCEQLARALRPLIREAHFSEWSAQHLAAGTEVVSERKQALEKATLVLLLLSSEYLASDDCYREMLELLERQQQGEIRVIPILLRPCDWLATPLASLQPLPKNGRAVTLWEKREQAFFTLTQEIRQIVGVPQPAVHLSSTRESHNRSQLIRRVRKTWIEGLLEHSLHEATWLHLQMQDQPEALVNPWQMTVQELDKHTAYTLPDNTSIAQVYDEAEGELLLTGEPGAGKTTLLLTLARTLLDRAQSDLNHPMPVIFNLSPFASQMQNDTSLRISDWLVTELQEKYHVPWKIGQYWIEARQILPLLDGLDEVAQEARDVCARAIIEYQRCQDVQVNTPLVVCCRSGEYAALPTHFPFNRAVSILPLSDRHIEQFFQQAGNQLDALHEVLQADTELAELSRSPLMLNIFALTYQNATASDLPHKTASEDRRSTVFSHYTERMLTRRGLLRTGTREQFLQRLIYLARNMQRRKQTIFHIRDVAPTWIYTSNSRQRGVTLLLHTLFLSLLASLSGIIVLPVLYFSSGYGNYLIKMFPILILLLLCVMIGLFIMCLLLGTVMMRFLSRTLLWRFGRLPWKLVPFLDEAVERLLLRKAGDNYMFTHKLLQEYLAAQGEFQEESFFDPGEFQPMGGL